MFDDFYKSPSKGLIIIWLLKFLRHLKATSHFNKPLLLYSYSFLGATVYLRLRFTVLIVSQDYKYFLALMLYSFENELRNSLVM